MQEIPYFTKITGQKTSLRANIRVTAQQALRMPGASCLGGGGGGKLPHEKDGDACRKC